MFLGRPGSGVDGVVEAAGRDRAVDRQGRFRRNVDAGVGLERRDACRPVLQLDDVGGQQTTEVGDPDGAVQADLGGDGGVGRVADRGNRPAPVHHLRDGGHQFDALGGLDADEHRLGAVLPADHDPQRSVPRQRGRQRSAERPGMDAVGQLKDHLPGTHVVEDRRPPQVGVCPRRGRDAEQDRVLGRGQSGVEIGSPLNADPGVLADQRPPGHGELVVAVGDRGDAVDVVDGAVHVEHQPTGVGGVPPALAQLPGGVLVGGGHGGDGRELERALCLVVGVVQVQVLAGVDRVDVEGVHQLGIALGVAAVEVQRCHRVRVRHRRRAPVGDRIGVERLGRIPVLDVGRDDVADGVLLVVNGLGTGSAVVDVAPDQPVAHPHRVGRIACDGVRRAGEPELNRLRHQGVGEEVRRVPGLALAAGQRQGDRDAALVHHLSPVVEPVLVPDFDLARHPQCLKANLADRQRQLEVDRQHLGFVDELPMQQLVGPDLVGHLVEIVQRDLVARQPPLGVPWRRGDGVERVFAGSGHRLTNLGDEPPVVTPGSPTMGEVGVELL